jgi:hypothetical protein
MGDIVKGVLGGGRFLLVGWLLPSALNLVLFGLVVAPQLGDARRLRAAAPVEKGVTLLVGAVVLGLLLAAAQTPLYRLLEGYLGWRPAGSQPRRWWRSPIAAALDASCDRQLRRKQILLGRLDLIELSGLEAAGMLREELRDRLAEVRSDPRLQRYAESDPRRTASQLGLLRERVRRYPVSDSQVVPTRLGNAIRRLEEYGYDRFRLDSQSLWYELLTVAPSEARKQIEQARTTVDFLVCLLYGNLLVALSAAVGAFTAGVRWPNLLGLAVLLVLLAVWWYRMAVVATDDWAAATRALVNVGRKPLAAELGLRMPSSLTEERRMWAAVSRLSARPFDSRSAEGDTYRMPDAVDQAAEVASPERGMGDAGREPRGPGNVA